MDFKLSPDAAGNGGTTEASVLPPLDKPFIKTSGKLKVAQLKKYVAKKLLGDADQGADDIEILCNGESLGAELSLYFIKCTRWVAGETHLLLNYRRRSWA